ncbi:MAG: NAD(P)-binding domain-containing protein [Archaeoglobus sp.]|nr:NAD(P)-binding domain-containing protein [Archaeoglobus sp.]
MKTGVIGAGTMGAAIAALFANAGYDVVLVDVNDDALEKARKRHEGEDLEQIEQAGLKRRDEIISKIKYTTNLEDVGDCDFIVEAIPEKLDLKIKVMKKIESLVSDDCVLATNTSSFKPSEVAAGLKKPERLVLFHFSNPPILMKIVEIAGDFASEDAIGKAIEVARKIGKEPVLLKKECRGHIFNRFLGVAGVAGAWELMHARPEEIDAALKALGSPYGFFELLDLIGIDVVIDVLNSFKESYGRKFEPPKGMAFFLERMLEWNKLGKKSGEGFYKWVEGKAMIPDARPYDITPIISAVVNEAFLELEEGIADKETINEAYKLATGSPLGVFEVAEMLGYNTILELLERLYRERGAEIYKPAEKLREASKN